MMKGHLIFPNDLPEMLKLQYSVHDLHKCLEGVMLERNGCNFQDKTVNVCRSCQVLLEKDTLPQNAIANGLYYGHAPEFLSKLNRTEIGMINWSIPCVTLHPSLVVETKLSGHIRTN
jgi:hypothetical protein